jgi:hypothetical protein
MVYEELMASSARPRVLLVYHFFHPDEVVSARLFTDLGAGLSARGWDVTALTSNRTWNSPRVALPSREVHQGVAIERSFRPRWDQARPLERLGNSAWLSVAWLARIARLPAYDAIVIGSDPAFALAIAPVVRRLRPRTTIVHWCFDLYPEAIVADGTSRATSALLPGARGLMARGYAACDAIVDLGPRMRERLAAYGSNARRETIVPWALVEPARSPEPRSPEVREALFGKDAKLGLLYSGTLGRAHDFRTFLALARSSRARFGPSVALAFASRGGRVDELRAALDPGDTNVRLVDFCAEEKLGAQLEAADVHLISLRPEWSGLVVPSKYFGSLAIGRPALYAGPAESDIARWIQETGVGMTIEESTLPRALQEIAGLLERPERVLDAQRRARAAYESRFSKPVSLERWDGLLRGLVARATRQDSVMEGACAASSAT